MLALSYIDAQTFRTSSVDKILSLVAPARRSGVGAQRDKVIGALIGLATGDAFGAPVEFWSRGQVQRTYPGGLGEMRASRNWALGEYTDDTEMALLLADSLLERGHLDSTDVAARFQHWTRTAKDVGIQIRRVAAMRAYVDHPEESARADYALHPNNAAGNGAVMRCAPIALFHWDNLPMLLADSRRSARITHGDPKAQSSCILINAAIVHFLTGGGRDQPWKHGMAYLTKNERSAWTRLSEIADLREGDLSGSGYTVSSVESAFWSFVTTSSFEAAVERAVSLGDDTDTTAAITGALAGAWYGADGIPERWHTRLMHAKRIQLTALKLAGLQNGHE
jgi:ADP-ribosyl-[dinitrogen reductase] hydrolase